MTDDPKAEVTFYATELDDVEIDVGLDTDYYIPFVTLWFKLDRSLVSIIMSPEKLIETYPHAEYPLANHYVVRGLREAAEKLERVLAAAALDWRLFAFEGGL